MLTTIYFTEAYKKVCNAFNREAKPDQAQFFLDQLRGFNDEDIQAAVNTLIDGQRLPTLKDWKVAFSESHRKNRKDSPIPFGRCPKCNADTISKKCDDDEWYEICTKCAYKEILYTFGEWKSLTGFDAMSPAEIGEKLRMAKIAGQE